MNSLDTYLFGLTYAAWGGALTGLASAFSAIGGGWAVLGLLPFCAAARSRRWALFLTASLATNALLVFVLKRIFARDRPCVVLPGVHPLCALPTDPSFPSGHASGSFTFAVFVVAVLFAGNDLFALRFSRKRRAALSAGLLALAFAVAWSRVYLGVHFPGDVTAGALLGTLVGAFGAKTYLRSVKSPLFAEHSQRRQRV